MGYVVCKECSAKMPRTATHCESCGFPHLQGFLDKVEERNRNRRKAILIMVMFISGVLWLGIRAEHVVPALIAAGLFLLASIGVYFSG